LHIYLSNFYLDRTINIIQWCIHGCFIIVDNVKPVTEPRVCSLNATEALCGRCHLGCFHINSSYFPWQKFIWGKCLALLFVFWIWPIWPDEFCVWLGLVFFCVIWSDCFGRLLSTNHLLPLIFTWTFLSLP
jgi:hypothetical protein